MEDFKEVFEENQSEYSDVGYQWDTWEEFCDALIFICESEINKLLNQDYDNEGYDIAGYYEQYEDTDIYKQIYNMTTVGTYKFQRVDVDKQFDDGSVDGVVIPAGVSMIKRIVSCFTQGLSVDGGTFLTLSKRISRRLSEDPSEDGCQALSKKILRVREEYRVEHDLPTSEHWEREQGTEIGNQR